MSQTRRTFLAGAGAATLTASSWARVAGTNSDLRVACVGVRGRGRSHIDGFRKLEGVRVVALCDVDQHVLAERAKPLLDAGESVELFTDLRALLEWDGIDAITLATPNHLHALQAIWAIQAGKDVYVEKPVSHNVWEGRQLVRAARRHQRIVQTGTQSRSATGLQELIAWLRAGNLGRIQLVRGLCYKPRQSIGKVREPTVIPDTIDYDLWCGPAPKVPLMRQKLHYDWHWVAATGNGDVGNQGIHQMDIARWLLGEPRLSRRVLSIGGRVGYDDDGNTPNTQVVYHDFETAPLIFEVRGLPRAREFQEKDWGGNMDTLLGARIGVIAYCEGGYASIYSGDSGRVIDLQGKEIARFGGSANHFQNFVDAVRSRRTSDLHADIEDGHVSSALCHLGNISHQLGQPAGPSDVRAVTDANVALSEAYGRMRDHLEANGVDPAAGGVQLGPWLDVNPISETFVDQPEAAPLLTRDYRAPYIVPQIV